MPKPNLTEDDLRNLQVALVEVNSLEELADVSSDALSSTGVILYHFGIKLDDVKQILDSIANLNKYFAAQYHRLCEEGKIPEEHKYKGGK